MARKTKTLAIPSQTGVSNLLDDINPASSVSEALTYFYRYQPTFTDDHLTTIQQALASHYPWKDIKDVIEAIENTPWN